MNAVIDIGSNAIRLRIGGLGHDGCMSLIEAVRTPVRLGQDAFGRHRLSTTTVERALQAFQDFRTLLERKGVPITQVRALATSAMREAVNRQTLIDRVEAATGIRIEVISGEEEARLISLAVRHALPQLTEGTALAIDIGGGSVEVSVLEQGRVTALESFKMGTVRLLTRFGGEDQAAFIHLLEEFFSANEIKVRELIDGTPIGVAVGTGGNIEALGELGRTLLGNQDTDRLSYGEVKKLCRQLDILSYEERIEQLKLRPDRADVIVPAAHVLRRILKLAGKPDLLVPGVGLAEGALLEGLLQRRTDSVQDALAWARAVGRKYHTDQPHAEHVRFLALQLFDQLAPVHELSARDRLLLEMAALLHEIGIFVRPDSHHRHAWYLIKAMPMLGISEPEQQLLATVVRCQRKKLPDENSALLKGMDQAARERWLKLVVLLRLARALNKERRNGIRHLQCRIDDNLIEIRADSEGDLLLERWAALRQRPLAERILGRKLELML